MSENTLDKFKSFYGTESYHDYNGTYAYTDGIQYLVDKLELATRTKKLMKFIIKNMNYQNPFGCFKLIVTKKCTKIASYNADNHLVDEQILWKSCKLTEGEYKMFCYNYIILAATEY